VPRLETLLIVAGPSGAGKTHQLWRIAAKRAPWVSRVLEPSVASNLSVVPLCDLIDGKCDVAHAVVEYELCAYGLRPGGHALDRGLAQLLDRAEATIVVTLLARRGTITRRYVRRSLTWYAQRFRCMPLHVLARALSWPRRCLAQRYHPRRGWLEPGRMDTVYARWFAFCGERGIARHWVLIDGEGLVPAPEWIGGRCAGL